MHTHFIGFIKLNENRVSFLSSTNRSIWRISNSNWKQAKYRHNNQSQPRSDMSFQSLVHAIYERYGEIGDCSISCSINCSEFSMSGSSSSSSCSPVASPMAEGNEPLNELPTHHSQQSTQPHQMTSSHSSSNNNQRW
jgi:hypothetical protein